MLYNNNELNSYSFFEAGQIKSATWRDNQWDSANARLKSIYSFKDEYRASLSSLWGACCHLFHIGENIYHVLLCNNICRDCEGSLSIIWYSSEGRRCLSCCAWAFASVCGLLHQHNLNFTEAAVQHIQPEAILKQREFLGQGSLPIRLKDCFCV